MVFFPLEKYFWHELGRHWKGQQWKGENASIPVSIKGNAQCEFSSSYDMCCIFFMLFSPLTCSIHTFQVRTNQQNHESHWHGDSNEHAELLRCLLFKFLSTDRSIKEHQSLLILEKVARRNSGHWNCCPCALPGGISRHSQVLIVSHLHFPWVCIFMLHLLCYQCTTSWCVCCSLEWFLRNRILKSWGATLSRGKNFLCKLSRLAKHWSRKWFSLSFLR
jgi:hypothetical protein